MLPLEGTRILDMTRLAPGPLCTMILGDLGADVLKIEEPGSPTGRRVEQARGTPTAVPTPSVIERTSAFNALNRNKKSITLNLKNEEARQVFYKLTETADVVVEEFRPGVTKRLGVDYDTLKKINPGIIYCAVTGYGQDGPYRDRVGHDINYISTAGALGIIGEKGHSPAIPHNLLADFAGGGMHGAIGILAALMAREKTGKGQFVDIAMTDGVVLLLAQALSAYFAGGEVPERGNTRLSGGVPNYNTYETKDGKYISLGSLEPWFYANLCRAVGREDFILYEEDTGEKQQEIFAAFRELFRTKTGDEWFELLGQTDVCAAKVNSFDDLASDPQLMHRKMIVEIEHPTQGKIKQIGISIKLSETPGEIRSLAPTKGEHTDEIMAGLGYSEQRISELREKGVV